DVLHNSAGLRVFLSLVSNPGNSGGPVFDMKGRVVGLLEGNLKSPIRDDNNKQVVARTVKTDEGGNLVKDASGEYIYEVTPLWQNSGISIAVPARAIAELAKENNIDLQ